MIELPNGKVARTQAEQVGFNSKKIEEIIKFLNESGLKDLVINLEAASGVLTDDQYAIAEMSPSYIVLSGKVYYKGYEDGTNIDFFEAVPEAAAATSLFLQVARIRIVEATKNYALSSVNIFESYNKSQIDSIVSTLNSAISAKAALAGANFTGAITASSIIENMSGYYATKIDDLTWTNKYTGVCKNGNKITFVVFGSYTYNAGDTTKNIVAFSIPNDVFNKLYPYAMSGFDDVLASLKIDIFSNLEQSKELYVSIRKTGGQILFAFRNPNNAGLTDQTQYVFRIEQTFLLNNSLISQ